MLASPVSEWPSEQLNVINAPTACLRGPNVVRPLVPSILPLIGTEGCGH